MSKFGLLFVFFGLLQIITPAAVDTTQGNNVDFSYNLYSTIVNENPDNNLIVSPFSIHTALSLLYNGANGKTQEQLANGLKLSANDKDLLNKNFKETWSKYSNNPQIQIANKIYVSNNGITLKPNYRDTINTIYNSEIEKISFENSKNAIDEINKWVAQKTNNKIKSVINDLSSDTIAVLLNAIYFKAQWQNEFQKSLTEESDFWITADKSIKVNMMKNSDSFSYKKFDDLDASGISFPYENSDFSLFILLPNKRNGLNDLEAKLKNVNILELESQLKEEYVNVKIPKFKIETTTELDSILKKLGMESIYSDDADFSEMVDGKMKISKAIHKAFIEVNEEGTEAAAVTGMKIMAASARKRTIFNANHPFLYVIKTNRTILFIGRLLYP